MTIQNSNPSRERIDIKQAEQLLKYAVERENYEQAASIKWSIDREKKIQQALGAREENRE